MEAPQRFVRHDVGGCGGCIARHDQPVPDECLAEEADDDDDQVQHAANSCVKLWRCFNGTSCHFGPPLGWGSHVSKTAKRGAPPLAERLIVTLVSFHCALRSPFFRCTSLLLPSLFVHAEHEEPHD